MTTAADLAQILSEYAQAAEGGVIVELGTYHGKGTVALAQGTARGSRRTIYTVDDFTRKTGWIGEIYDFEDYSEFLKNVMASGFEFNLDVIHVHKTFDAAVAEWVNPIALLYWDPGMRERCLWDFTRWAPHIIKNGIYIIKDTPHDDLGSRIVIDSYVAGGDWEIAQEHRGVTFLRRIG